MGPSRYKVHHSVVLLLVCLLPLTTAEAAPPDDCLAYAYTESEHHAFLIQQNSSNFGSNLKVKTDCERVNLWVDGYLVATSNESFFEFEIEQGVHNITLESAGFTEHYERVSFYPDRLNWEFEWLELSGANVEYITSSEADLKENWASFLSVIIAWFLSTYVFWQLVQAYVQRNFIEEVIN